MTSGTERNSRLDAIRRADALIAMGRWSQVLQELAPLLAGPGDVDALCRASQALLRLGRDEEALAMAERAIMAAPGNEWTHRLRSHALLQASRKVKGSQKDELLSAAVDSAREAVRLAPGNAVTHRSATEILLAAGQLPVAAAAAGEAVRLNPNSAESWIVAGRVALAQGRTQDAENCALRALQIQPNNATAWNNLGVAIQRQGRWREATTAYLKAARLSPPNSVARGNVCRSGLTVLQLFALLALLPLMLLPFGPAIYVVVFAAGCYLCRPGGALRSQTETAAIRVAMRLERLPLQRKVTQVLGRQISFRLVVFVVMLVFILAAGSSSSGIGSGVALIAFLTFIVLLGVGTRGRGWTTWGRTIRANGRPGPRRPRRKDVGVGPGLS